jgi:hypothetical protein
MTKADKIRGMTDEQLADFLTDVIDCWHCPTYQECTNVKSCDNALLAWLQQKHVESNATLTQL